MTTVCLLPHFEKFESWAFGECNDEGEWEDYDEPEYSFDYEVTFYLRIEPKDA